MSVDVLTIGIGKIRKRVFLYTSRKARLLALKADGEIGKDLEEEYTLGYESEIRESLVVPFDVEGKISQEVYRVEGEPEQDHRYDLVCLRYDKGSLKRSFFLMASNELIVGDDTRDEYVVSIGLDFEEVFENCSLISSNRARYLVSQDVDFDNLTITDHERELVMHFFEEGCVNVSAVVGEPYSVLDKGWKVMTVFGERTMGNITDLIRRYMEAFVLSRFYRVVLQEGVWKEYEVELGALIDLLRVVFRSFKHVDILLGESASKVFEAMYCLCKDLPVSGYVNGKDELVFRIEKRMIPVTGSAVMNIYNYGEAALLNGMLFRCFVGLGRNEDARVSMAAAEDALRGIRVYAEKRAKYADVFPTLLGSGAEIVKVKLLAYNKRMGTLSYLFDEARDEIVFGICRENYSGNILDAIRDCIGEFLFYDVLYRWYDMCGVRDEVESMGKCVEISLSKLTTLLTVRKSAGFDREYRVEF